MPKRKSKRMRLPNGFGQISEIKNRRLRKPFRAMVTVGKTETGKPICKPLKPQAYFATYNEAYEALVKYHQKPYDYSTNMTLNDLYEKWFEYHTKSGIAESTIRAIKAAWGYCSEVYDVLLSEARPRHVRHCLDHGTRIVDGIERTPSSGLKRRMKANFNQMFDYAMEYGYIEQNYSRMLRDPQSKKKVLKKSEDPHITFTDEEMKILWDNAENIPVVKVILIQCYSGWRPQELGKIKRKDVDLKNWTFTGGMKTEAGSMRVVPIHSKIRPFVEEKYHEAVSIGSEYLINIKMEHTSSYEDLSTYYRYYYLFKRAVSKLKLNEKHRPHDPRKHFITMAKNSGVNEYAIKYLVGHVIEDLTERVYTDRDVEWLREELEKIK